MSNTQNTQKTDAQQAAAQGVAPAVCKNITEDVLARVHNLEAEGGLKLPPNYSAENSLKSAWLVLQETNNRSGQNVLTSCTTPSIANALFDMVIQGLSVAKKQGYFIAYGDKLLFQRSYFGAIAIAKRVGAIKDEPRANLVYEGDNFVYEVAADGRLRLVKHEQSITNIDDKKIVGVYCIVTRADDSTDLVVMSMEQVRRSWAQGATKGNSPAHQNFTGEMAKKTVINRALKAIINSSDDGWMFQGSERPSAEEDRDETLSEKANSKPAFDFETAEVVDLTGEGAAPTEEAAPAETPSGDEPAF